MRLDFAFHFLKYGMSRTFYNFDPNLLGVIPEAVDKATLLVMEDLKRLRKTDIITLLELDSGFLATFIYRISHQIFKQYPDHPLLPYLAQFAKVRTGTEIYYAADIGPGFLVIHGFGTVIGPRHRIGENFTVFQGVTIGQRHEERPDHRATIGDNCTFYAGSKVFGTVMVGDGVKLGANAVLLHDAEAYATYVGTPARMVTKHADRL